MEIVSQDLQTPITNPRSSRNAKYFSIALWVHFGRVRLKAYWQYESCLARFLHFSSPRPAIGWRHMKTLSRDRSEAIFDFFWTRLLKKKSEVDAAAEPQLPRKRRECIRTRFNGKDFKVYRSIQEVLLKAAAGEDHKKEQAIMMAVYGDTDLPPYKLGPQLSLIPDVVQTMGYDTSRFDITDLLGFFQSIGNALKLLLR